ncbi:hypothetical protein ALC62_04575 [Cyphomyrmex costatus]|uniref:Uncharacterized protein n=1 Tax=Cyphomyrmex costatus TaxID=456900 RepID=A0A195CWQ2_9HYME|nr:hypothetical protein ALC62_04575 [Cyphomyrmex costatus]
MRVWASNATAAGGRGWRLTDAVIDNVIDHCAPKLGRVRVDGYHRRGRNAVWGEDTPLEGDKTHDEAKAKKSVRQRRALASDLDFDQNFGDLLRESQSPSQSVSTPSQANPPTSGVNPETNCAV